MAQHTDLTSQERINTADDVEDIIVLPQVDNSELVAQFRLSLVGRIFHQEGRSIDALIAFLPRSHIWDVEGRVRGLSLGNYKFQFDFDSEADLVKVLAKRPCHFNKWSFSLERWAPHIHDDFPNTMTFWTRVEGIPTHFWLAEIFERIGSALGQVVAVDARASRMQITLNGDRPLHFDRKVMLPSGEIVPIKLSYEKLYRWCFTCRMISHEERTCPLLSEEQRKEKRAVREAAREASILEQDLAGRLGPSKGLDREKETSYKSKLDIPEEARDRRRYQERKPDHDPHERHYQPGKEDPSRWANRRNREESRPTLDSVWKRLDSHQSRASREINHPAYPRYRESSGHHEGAFRKRRHDDEATSSKWRPSGVRLKEETQRKDLGISSKVLKAHVPPQKDQSDSQLTISDYPRDARFDRHNGSPSMVRSRPYRLNL